mmetsp:Transcript_14236/g.28857  ORF Transcript_14236/g.28857 Transcript_14236/m.28857 type:complete len:297 (-) Transcript_14236:77-967(-)
MLVRSAATMLLLAGVHSSVLTRQHHSTAPRRWPALLAEQSVRVHRLRGGEAPADSVAAAPGADATAAAASKAAAQPAPTLVDEPPPPTCWSAVLKVWGVLKSLLLPNHQYAKAEEEEIKQETPEKSCGYAADDEGWRTQRKKLNQVELPPACRKRVLRDLRRLKAHDDDKLVLEDAECLTDWVVKMVGAPGTVFAGEIYRLRVRFHVDYPTRPPTVVFMRPAPMYEHVYSNGMVCLDLLGAAWDPRLDVLAICLSIQSMISSAKVKSRPPDNEVTSVMAKGQDARDMAWHPHDDDC